MRIIVVSFSFFPEVDGVANAAGQMVDFFLDAGHEVDVVTGCSQRPDAPTSERFKIHRFGVYKNESFDSNEARSYIDFLIKSQAAVIIFHCWDAWPTDIALKHLKQISGKKILLSHGYATHRIHWHTRFPWGLWTWLKRLPKVFALPYQLASFDQVVFLSMKTDRDRFFDSWIARKLGCRNISVIPNAVNNTGWSEIAPDFKKRHNLNSGSFFLCVANYSPRKNQLMALEAFCEANISNSSLVFIGSSLGDYGAEVREKWLTLRNSLNNIAVYFFENLERIEVISALRTCDIFVLSSTAETQPIALLEAMACGKAFITSDTGCVSEFEGGIIVSSKQEMVKQMQNLSNYSTTRCQLGEHGAKCFNNQYSSSAAKRAWLELIERIT